MNVYNGLMNSSFNFAGPNHILENEAVEVIRVPGSSYCPAVSHLRGLDMMTVHHCGLSLSSVG